jgi:hypothetical protein
MGRLAQIVWRPHRECEVYQLSKPRSALAADLGYRAALVLDHHRKIDLVVSDDNATFEIETPMGSIKKKLSEFDHTPFVESYGKLAREIRISRQPTEYQAFSLHLNRSIDLIEGDNPLWVCASFDDGHQAWSSPIYFIAE